LRYLRLFRFVYWRICCTARLLIVLRLSTGLPLASARALPAVLNGDPDRRHISTGYVERQSLNMRMGLRRFTRLTNAFSKKFENHAAMIASYHTVYNFCRVHQNLARHTRNGILINKSRLDYRRTGFRVARCGSKSGIKTPKILLKT
jgi:hypothetical protein